MSSHPFSIPETKPGGFRRLRHLTLTAGDFDCQGLSALFEIAAGVRSLRLRGSLVGKFLWPGSERRQTWA